MDFKEHIIEKIVDITGLEREVVEKSVEVPPDEKMGDIAFPCFPLAKVMRKAPPIIAQELAEKMSGDDMIEKAQAAGGYLNFFLNREKFISETVSSALDAGEDWGKSDMGTFASFFYILYDFTKKISINCGLCYNTYVF